MSALRRALRELPEAVFADVLESDLAYLFVLDLPGVSADRVSATVEGGRLVVEAERAKDVPDEFDFVREDRSLFLDLELPLPSDVDGEAAEGSVERGVLRLRLPKTGTASDTAIPVEDA